MSQLRFGPYAGLLIEGVVVAHYPVGAGLNEGGPVDLYDVDPMWPNMPRLQRCVLAQRIGYNSGLEEQARPASLRVDNNPALDDSTPRSLTNGDRVLVQFINGSPQRPVITHFVPHSAASWLTKADDFKGPVVRRRHNGTEVLYDHEGNVVVSLDDGDDPVKRGDAKTVDLRLGGQQQVHLEKDLIKLFGGSKKVARDGDTVTITVTQADVTAWKLSNGGGPVVAASPFTITGKIDGGSDKLKTD